MSTRPLLEGHMMSEQDTALLERFKELERQIAIARKDASEALDEIAKLKGTLRAAFSFDGVPPIVQVGGWQERIAKVGGPEGRILQTLLDGGGEMSLTQIRQAARTFNNTSTYLNRLKAKNWVVLTGRGMYALKQL